MANWRTVGLSLLFVLLTAVSNAQYSLEKEQLTNQLIPATENFNIIKYKIKDSIMYQIRTISDADKGKMIVTKFEVKNGTFLHADTIQGLPEFKIYNFDFTSSHIFISGTDKYICFDFNTINDFHLNFNSYNGYVPAEKKQPPFKDCRFLNDSLVLLFVAYNYHPLDNAPGLYLSIFNIRSQRFERKYFMKFPGIGLSHLNVDWITVVKDKIYAVTPLTGKVYCFDFALRLLSTKQLNLFTNNELISNMKYEASSDSMISAQTDRINHIISVTPSDSFNYLPTKVGSSLYGKNFIYDLVNNFGKTSTYIQKVFDVDDSFLGICISTPLGGDTTRELFIVDPNSGTIIKHFDKWRCVVASEVLSVEDLLTINLKVGMGMYPYFHNGHIYTGNLFRSSYFHPTTGEKLNEEIFNIIKKNGLTWSILEYRY